MITLKNKDSEGSADAETYKSFDDKVRDDGSTQLLICKDKTFWQCRFALNFGFL